MKMSKPVKFVLFFILPIAIFILWLGGFIGHRVEPGESAYKGKVITGLETVTVQMEEVPQYYKADGNVSGENNAKVSTKWMGRILKIYVQEGDYVKAGQLLAKIDNSEVVQQRNEAIAGLDELSKAREEALAAKKAAVENYEFAKRTYERFKNLYQENAVSKQQLEEIETKMVAAKSMVDQVNAKLAQIDAKEKQVKAKIAQVDIVVGYGEVRAPFDGYVVKKMMDEGDMAAPGMPILIVGDKKLQFIAYLDESLLDKVKVGDEYEIEVGNKRFKAKVVEKNSNINPMNRTFTVKFDIPYDESLTSGMYGKLYIPISKTQKILVPKTAVFKWGQLTAVYTVSKDGTIKLTYVKTGEDYGDKVEIVAGLEPGTKIIVKDVERACDGCKLGG
ncbi:MAG: efflux RND transporter periplasmic adaptor subunit [Hydrogenothermaceae bacterium]